MPRYDYKCSSCMCVEEHVLPISSDPTIPLECKCGGSSTRLISRISFQLQGDGWPGKSNTREVEDNKIHHLAHQARELKKSGRVGMDDHLDFSDVKKLAKD